jgi:hypothetical protein
MSVSLIGLFVYTKIFFSVQVTHHCLILVVRTHLEVTLGLGDNESSHRASLKVS